MTTLAATRFNPVIKEFYQRLLKAIIRDRKPWNPQFVSACS
jgi:hypothetical protein